MGVDAKPLTEKQEAFARLYAGDGVAAARAAGYSGNSAGLAVTASRLLRDPRIKAILEERRRRDLGEPSGGSPAAPLPRARRTTARRAPRPNPIAPPPPDEFDPERAPPAYHRVNVRAAVADAEAEGVDPIAVLEAIACDSQIHPSSRVAAAKALERHRRETGGPKVDPYVDLRARVREILRAKRERDREEMDR